MDEHQHDENCENCGMNHNSNEVPFVIAATARLVIEKAMNLTLDPSNPLNQLLVMGAGTLLDGIASGAIKEQEIDLSELLRGTDE